MLGKESRKRLKSMICGDKESLFKVVYIPSDLDVKRAIYATSRSPSYFLH